jgi:hypothetical protein
LGIDTSLPDRDELKVVSDVLESSAPLDPFNPRSLDSGQ